MAYATSVSEVDIEQRVWRSYVADSIRAAAQGKYQSERYAEIIGRMHGAARHGQRLGFEQIVESVIERTGLEVV